MALNKIIIMGRLTADPEVRYTQSNVPVASMTLAVDRDFKDKQSGERATDFIDVIAWRQTAEFASKYFSKGRMAVVSGRLQTRTYEDKNGTKRKAVEVVAEQLYFGDSKREEAAATNPPQGPEEWPEGADLDGGLASDDLPF